MINKTFSKGDLLEIISTFGIDIPNANNLDKLRLSILLWSEIGNLSEIPEDNEIYMIIPTRDISIHGDIPSVRRAIGLLNKDPNLKEKIIPVVSNKMKKQLEKKKNKKVKKYYGLIYKSGSFVVEFN